MAEILMVIAPDRFRDEELFETRRVLEEKGHRVTVAGHPTGLSRGTRGGEYLLEEDLYRQNPDLFDAIIFVGGGGAEAYFDNPVAHQIAGTMLESGKVTAAICIAPVILARAGLLSGRRATVFPDGKEELIRAGALYQEEPVVTDGLLITADGPGAAEEFALAVSGALTGGRS